MSKTYDFAIVGAGIAGLASAIALARAGHSATVFEQARQIDEVGAGLQIGPNAARALELLGVWQALEPDTFAPEGIAIRDGRSGRNLSTIDLTSGFADRFGAPYRVAHRAQLIAHLLHAARQYDHVDIRTDSPVESYEKNADGVSLRLADGNRHSADALIAADGIRSQIRHAMIGDGPPDYAGHAIYRALLPMIDVPAATDKTSVNLWLYPGGHIVHYPVNGGRQLNIVAAADSLWVEDGWKAAAGPDEVASLFADAAPDLKQLLTAPDRWLKWAAADRNPINRWSDGPVVLIGDAAHPTLPYLAQGAAMALEDAVVLGHCLQRSTDIASAFDLFTQNRAQRTARVTATSRQQATTYHLKSAAALARNLTLAAMPAQLQLSRLSWLYKWIPPGQDV